MIPLEVLIVFIPAALALNLTPGNDMMFCLGQGLRSGPEAGIAASLGITAGGFVHTFAAAAGLAALLAEHPAAFDVIRWAGAAYLVFLAIQALRSSAMLAEPAASRISPARAFRDAMVVNVTNPKIVVFVFAFLPQFVDPERGSSFLQFVLLGSILNIGGLLINGAVGAGAGRLRGFLSARAWLVRSLHYATATIFLGLAARIAFDRR